MNKSDLKDGMIIVSECGDKRIVFDNGRKYFNELRQEVFSTEFLFENKQFFSRDVIKVVYGGETVWEREKEYLTLEEAIETGKPFKHKDCKSYYFNLHMIIEDLRDYCVEHVDYTGTKEINQYILSQINSRVWEVKEDEQD